MQWTLAVSRLLDSYDFKARLIPGLLVLLPMICFLVLMFGYKYPALTAVASLLSICGGPYALCFNG